jgi:hypothetical protein
MRLSRAAAWSLALLSTHPGRLAAQLPDSAPERPRTPAATGSSFAPRRRTFAALSEAMLLNLFVNRMDAWAMGQSWAQTGPRSWSRNLRLGWEWDENAFTTNMFAHPYHGGLYFNAGRDNGLDFWQSAPLSFLGSATWEFFGETYRPSLNDFFMTSFGGVALGEVFHRVGASIRDNESHGGRRLFRELAALPVDPVGGLNRLIRGQWSAWGPNPPEHRPEAFVVRVLSGLRLTGDTTRSQRLHSSATLLVDLAYGDPVIQPYRKPFDAFTVRLQVSSTGGGQPAARLGAALR